MPGSQSADLDAWYLLEYVTGVSRSQYFLDPEREVPQEQEALYRSDDRQEKHPHSAAASDRGAGVYGPYIQGQQTCADPQTGHRGAGGRGTELCEERHGHSGCVYRIGMHLIERSEAGREKVPWNPSRNRCGSVQRGFAGGRRKCRAASGRRRTFCTAISSQKCRGSMT